jgi:uncharacterized protein YijF (DUF1287 family)
LRPDAPAAPPVAPANAAPTSSPFEAPATAGIEPPTTVSPREANEPPAASDHQVASLGPVLPPESGSTSVTEGAPANIEAAVCLPAAAPREEGRGLAESFGGRLAAAALAQTEQFVIYSARYRRLAFPMGDLAPFYGACTDVVIRAYRSLGIDLQQLVHEARLGSGDPSVDHRRTEVLRKFFTRYGESLPVSPFPEDYLPGDIVTYERPFSRVSRAHIAIVAEALAPSGRPMIVHNRGWGPQLEDALFADRITGHYRFHGLDAQPAQTALKGSPGSTPARLAAARRIAR